MRFTANSGSLTFVFILFGSFLGEWKEIIGQC